MPHRKRSKLVGIGVATAFVASFFVVSVAFAQGDDLGITNLANQAGASVTDIRVIVARIIRVFLSTLGIIALGLTLYGGFLWMTSGGDEDKVAKAKRLLLNAVIGLAIIFSALAITQFILSRLLLATGLEGGPGGGGRAGRGASIPRSGSLGIGIIENHYPARGASDVPRNARVMITFKEAILPESLSVGINFKLFRDADGPNRALPPEAVRVGFTADRKTFVFDPVDLLGSPSENVGHTVSLTGGADGVRKADGEPAFGGSFADGYEWNFIVGTTVDLTPPRVDSVIPRADSSNPRNTVIEVNFSEAMDPTTVTGAIPGAVGLGVVSGSDAVPGSFTIGNAYRTIRFLSNDRCGANACGGDVFCLPGGARITATVGAATLGQAAPEAIFPPDGATDTAGNSLDGDGDGAAEGPAADTYSWQFSTTDVIDLSTPVVEIISPASEEANVAPDRPVEITWSKRMSLASFTSAAIQLGSVPAEPATCYSLSGAHLGADDAPGVEPFIRSKSIIGHCAFLANTNYLPKITEAVQDVSQNCYLPGAANIPTMQCRESDLEAAGARYCCSGQPSVGPCQILPGGRPVPSS